MGYLSFNAKISSLELTNTDDGPSFFYNHEMIVASVLPPLYSLTSPSLKNLRVGNPLISTPSTSLAVESILAITKFLFPFNYSAAESHSGAKDLQCPHPIIVI